MAGAELYHFDGGRLVLVESLGYGVEGSAGAGI